MAGTQRPHDLSAFFPGIGLVLGAGVGLLAGVIVDGSVNVVGMLLAAGVGLVIGAALSAQRGGRTR